MAARTTEKGVQWLCWETGVMSVYDDPAAVASILQGAIDAAEEHGQDGERIGLEVLRAAVRHLRLIDGDGPISGGTGD